MTMEKGESQDAGTGTANATMPVPPEADRNHFPSSLHTMLSSLQDSPLAGACSWQPHGRVFMIRDTDLFINQVLPKWFCRLKFTSFQRQLCLYGFRKLSKKGPDQGGYYHPNFIRERLDLAATIQPAKIKGKRGRRPKSDENEPDFYQMSPPEVPRQAEVKSAPQFPSAPADLEGTPKASAQAASAASGSASQDPLASLKDDSPDQLSLEAIMHQPQYREDIFEHKQGLLARLGEAQWPTQQSLATASHPVSTAQRSTMDQDTNLQLEEFMFLQADNGAESTSAATMSGASISTRGISDFAAPEAAGPSWGWESLVGMEESPAVAVAQVSQAPAPGLAVASATGSALSHNYAQLQAQQLLPDEDRLHLQQILERQRLRDLMDLNQAQQENLKIQQEQLEQQRLELQIRDQEQLQQLREELHARENQQLLEDLRAREAQQRRQNPGQMLTALPRPPRLFEPQRGGRVAFHPQTQRKPPASQQQTQQQTQQHESQSPSQPPGQGQGQSGMFPSAFQHPRQDGRGNQQGR